MRYSDRGLAANLHFLFIWWVATDTITKFNHETAISSAYALHGRHTNDDGFLHENTGRGPEDENQGLLQDRDVRLGDAGVCDLRQQWLPAAIWAAN